MYVAPRRSVQKYKNETPYLFEAEERFLEHDPVVHFDHVQISQGTPHYHHHYYSFFYLFSCYFLFLKSFLYLLIFFLGRGPPDIKSVWDINTLFAVRIESISNLHLLAAASTIKQMSVYVKMKIMCGDEVLWPNKDNLQDSKVTGTTKPLEVGPNGTARYVFYHFLLFYL